MNLPRKLAYSFGAVATALSFQAFSAYIIFFYVDVVKLPPYLAAIAMLIYAGWNALNDPIAGYISDHTHSRWGRRTPYIAFGAIPLGIIFFLLWVPPFTNLDQAGLLLVYFLFFICLFDAFYSITIINWASLYPEMFPGLKERSEVNAVRQTFGMIGMMIGLVLPPLLFSSLGWGWMGMIFGAMISLSLLITLLGSREHIEFSRDKQLPLWRSVKATFQNRSFMTFVFANLFVQYSFITILATIPFFAKYVLEIDSPGLAAILAATFLAVIPMLYVWERLAVRFGAKRCFLTAIVLFGLALVPLFFIQTLQMTFLTAILLGAGLAGFVQVTDLLIADVIDEDETKTGTRREGMYFGVNAFIARFAIGLEALAMGLVFVVTGYSPYIHTQTAEFLSGLRVLLTVFPMVGLFFAFVILCFYPLAGKRLAAMEDEVANIHHNKGVN